MTARRCATCPVLVHMYLYLQCTKYKSLLIKYGYVQHGGIRKGDLFLICILAGDLLTALQVLWGVKVQVVQISVVDLNKAEVVSDTKDWFRYLFFCGYHKRCQSSFWEPYKRLHTSTNLLPNTEIIQCSPLSPERHDLKQGQIYNISRLRRSSFCPNSLLRILSRNGDI